jgi:hypothetical protein
VTAASLRTLDDAVAAGFTPFAFGRADNLERLEATGLRMLDSDHPNNRSFHDLLNCLNHWSYGAEGMGMPMWVQLDCGILPAAFVGFATTADRVPESLLEALEARLPGAAEAPLIPVAETLAIPSMVPGVWVSYSLCSAVRGLGFLSKLLGLKAYGWRVARGVAQYDSGSLRLHTRFGPLRLVEPLASYHTLGDRTFVYELDRPRAGALSELDRSGGLATRIQPTFHLDWQDGDQLTRMVEDHRAGRARFQILHPGRVEVAGRMLIPVLRTPGPTFSK